MFETWDMLQNVAGTFSWFLLISWNLEPDLSPHITGMTDPSNYSDYSVKRNVKNVDPDSYEAAPACLGVPQKNWNSFHLTPIFS